MTFSNQVVQLHAELEQERSKNSALKSDMAKVSAEQYSISWKVDMHVTVYGLADVTCQALPVSLGKHHHKYSLPR